ncbi:MAG TPA: hypothetical protein VKK79_03105, partial [Candidatus Lokiarchaeia archaeon]|nr:hypothetical protein [Candidatus Lokiarchaeia archaeon]
WNRKPAKNEVARIYNCRINRRKREKVGGGEEPGENPDQAARIWKIRDTIQVFEDLKDKIITLLEAQTEMDLPARDMWAGDTKEGYYSVVAAWEMLDGCRGAEGNQRRNLVEGANDALAMAEAKVKQSASELATIKGKQATQLNREWFAQFDQCRREILQELDPFTEKVETHPPANRVVKVHETEFQLPCSVCGKVSVIFRVGVPAYDDKQKLIVDGICASQGYDVNNADNAFSLLEANNLRDLHQLVKEMGNFEGIDAYCPDCDAIYCREHYNAREEYDEGFYDDTIGICPRGHRRMIDD